MEATTPPSDQAAPASPVSTPPESGQQPEAEGDATRTPVVSVIDGLLGLTRFLSKRPALLDSYQKFLTTIGLYAILVCGFWYMLHHIILTFRGGGATALFMGLLLGLVGAAVLHYIAAKFANAGRDIISADSQKMSSGAVLDCIGLLLLLGSIAFLIYGVVESIRSKNLSILWVSLIQFITAFHLAVFSLNPKEALNIHIVSAGAGAGETALAILSFIVRSVLAIAPILLGLGMVAMAVWMLVAMILSWTASHGMSGMVQFSMASSLAAAFALLPLISYLAYLLYMLLVDFYVAVLQTARNTAKSP